MHEAAAETAKLVQLVYQRFHGEVVTNTALLPRPRHDTRRPYYWQPMLARLGELGVQTLEYDQFVLQQQASLHEMLQRGKSFLHTGRHHGQHQR